MFKLVVLFSLLALIGAIPSGHIAYNSHATLISEPTHFEIHEPTLAKVGNYIENIPTAVSHQSSTIVHDSAKIITPVISPAIKTYRAPIIKSYAQPLINSYPAVPILSSYGGHYYH